MRDSNASKRARWYVEREGGSSVLGSDCVVGSKTTSESEEKGLSAMLSILSGSFESGTRETDCGSMLEETSRFSRYFSLFMPSKVRSLLPFLIILKKEDERKNYDLVYATNK